MKRMVLLNKVKVTVLTSTVDAGILVMSTVVGTDRSGPTVQETALCSHTLEVVQEDGDTRCGHWEGSITSRIRTCWSTDKQIRVRTISLAPFLKPSGPLYII